MKELLLALVLWVNQHPGFEYEDTQDLPEVVTVARPELSASVLRRATSRLVSWPERRALAREAKALYDPHNHVILVARDVDLETPEGRSLLVRELAVMLQVAQGTAAPGGCENLLARNAMVIQHHYLRTHFGLSLELDEESLLRLGACSL